VIVWEWSKMKNYAWENESIINYYSGLVERYGISPQSLDWGSEKTQKLRFSILTQIDNLNKQKILDLGCGQGDLLYYLKNNNIECSYTGYDITPRMIEVAKKRFPEAQLEVKDILDELNPLTSLPQFDYVLASGLFYLRKIEPLFYLKTIVNRMFLLCNKGVAFNSLSDCSAHKNTGEFYAKPAEILSICLELTPYVVLRHEYLSNDFTVYLYKKSL
jgi:SAM-dependent methyltransferase